MNNTTNTKVESDLRDLFKLISVNSNHEINLNEMLDKIIDQAENNGIQYVMKKIGESEDAIDTAILQKNKEHA